jgi:chorismate mutase/prephenate dehydratase
MDIKKSRAEIDTINRELVALFCRRMDVAAEIAKYKAENGLDVHDESREREILDEVARLSDDKYRDYTKEFFVEIMRMSREYQQSILTCGKGKN